MIKRNLEPFLLKSIEQNPAVVLTGPRQAGKTTLAKMVVKSFPKESIYLDLEDPSDKLKLTDPKLFLEKFRDKLVIIDEAQILPELFPLLRSMIDADRKPARFLLLGSALPSLERQSNQSLAGRVAYLNLSPLVLSELSSQDMNKLWLRGGFPLSVLAADEAFSIQWRKNFIRSYLGYDLRMMGYDLRIEPPVLEELLELLAHYQGQILNVNSIAAAMKLSRPFIVKYLDILKQTFMVRMLRPYSSNLKTQIVKSPKFYIRDTGILHQLLRIHHFDALFASKALGASWESFCLEQIIVQMDDSFSPYYLRTSAKQEVDLVLKESPEKEPILVEFKCSGAPKLEKGFYEIKDMLRPQMCYIVYPGQVSYPVAEDIEILSVGDLSRIWNRNSHP
jgi:predicted AAA+ superfamily ATPase